MKETGGHPSLPSVVDSAFLICHHQHLYGSSALETLPEAENEEEWTRSGRSSPAEARIEALECMRGAGLELERLLGDGSSEESRVCELEESCDISQGRLVGYEMESQRAKVLSLETTIRELREELRESKEQNELLEFRLLEIEELGSSQPTRAKEVCGDGKRPVRDVLETEAGLYGTEVSSETTIPGDYEHSNSHSSVAESRSSCSECSESLSLQESGIFETQFTDESGSGSGSGRQEEVGRELFILTSQIQGLLLRFSDGLSAAEEKGEGKSRGDFVPSPSRDGLVRKRGSHHSDLSSELKLCRERLTDFERRLTQWADVTYIRSLEDKVASLIHQNRGLEEERAEMEEAENDIRHECQRLEAKMQELREKKALLHHHLSNEKRYIEQLRIQVLQLREREDDLSSQISRTEALAQAHEQRNFDLEESQIEIKDSVQFLLNALPALAYWFLWPLWNSFHQLSPTSHRSHSRYRSLPMPPAQQGSSRKHKLAWKEPRSKKLRNETSYAISPLEMQAESEPLNGVPVNMVISEGGEEEALETILQRRIEVLEWEMEKWKEVAGRERSELAKSHERKLSELECSLGESLERLKEQQSLGEKWNRLIKELEQFEVFLVEALNEREGCGSLGNASFATESRSTSGPTGLTKIREGTLVARRIRSLFPDEWAAVSMEKWEVAPRPLALERTQLIQRLEQTVLDQIDKLERREKGLVTQIDELKSELVEKCRVRAESDNPHITHLLEENNRLEGMLGDQEKVWARITELEEETEHLRNEMSASLSLQRRLDEAQGAEKVLRLRVEELDQREFVLEEELAECRRKEKKWQEGVTQSRTEITFLYNKCCQLEEELDLRRGGEKKDKAQIQSLGAQVKACLESIEEKESLLHSRESLLQTQISKLETQLRETELEYGDTECTNGMLREEVLYLERTLSQLAEQLSRSETKALLLTSELQQREEVLRETQALLAQDQRASSDLDVFAMNEGGLVGVAREVHEVMNILQNERHLLLRCESEEHLSDSPPMRRDRRSESQAGSFQAMAEKSSLSQVRNDLGQGEQESELVRVTAELESLSLQLKEMEENYERMQNDEKDSHLNESFLWKMRCDEKNDLIQILARRIAHLSATDLHGYFLDGILREIRKVDDRYPVYSRFNSENGDCLPQDSRSLLSYFEAERRRIMELLESVCDQPENQLDSLFPQMDFRVLRRIGDDALLVSWTNGGRCSSLNIDGYEICVNGHPFLKVPNPNRYRALLFGLNLTEPLHLSLKCSGAVRLEESTITYIA